MRCIEPCRFAVRSNRRGQERDENPGVEIETYDNSKVKYLCSPMWDSMHVNGDSRDFFSEITLPPL